MVSLASLSPLMGPSRLGEIIDGNIFVHHFGLWKLYIADFHVSVDGTPSFTNKRDITPAGASWVEPGNFAPDGRHLLISSDVGMQDAQGQDQFVLDTGSGQLRNLTNSPKVWDEPRVYSPTATESPSCLLILTGIIQIVTKRRL